jgi:hypothetical protein
LPSKGNFFAIKNLITATKLLLQRQKSIYLLDPKFISKQRKFPTSSSPAISKTRPRDSASVFTKKTKAIIPVMTNINIDNLEDILKPIDEEAELYSTDNSEDFQNPAKLKKRKLDTITSVGANILALWSKKAIGDTGWKAGEDRPKLQLTYRESVET